MEAAILVARLVGWQCLGRRRSKDVAEKIRVIGESRMLVGMTGASLEFPGAPD